VQLAREVAGCFPAEFYAEALEAVKPGEPLLCMIDEVAALRPLPRSRRDSEVTEQQTNLLSHFLAMNDQVDEAVFLQKFSGLKSFGQLLVSGFFDHSRPGKNRSCFWAQR